MSQLPAPKPRAPSLFEKLNKLTSINYPNLHDSNSTRLFNLKSATQNELKPQNIYKINYTIIQNNDCSPTRKRNQTKYTGIIETQNPLPHKSSLFFDPNRKTTIKKRSFSESGRISLSTINENQSSPKNYPINFFEKMQPHAIYFSEVPISKQLSLSVENSVSLSQEKSVEKTFPNKSLNQSAKKLDKIPTFSVIQDFNTCKESKEIPAQGTIEIKPRTNSLGAKKSKPSFQFKKSLLSSSGQNIHRPSETIKMSRKPNISLDLNILENDYDFGMKEQNYQGYRQSIFIQNESEPVDHDKNTQKAILVIKEETKPDPIEANNELEKDKSNLLHQERSSIADSSQISSLKPIEDSERVSMMKTARKKDRVMTRVKFNDYQNQKDPKKSEKDPKFCSISNFRKLLCRVLSFFDCRKLWHSIKLEIDRGIIEVLITS